MTTLTKNKTKKPRTGSRGIKKLSDYLNGAKLTRKDAMLAKCAECTCRYADGMVDCESPTCPMYEYMPYRGRTRQERGQS